VTGGPILVLNSGSSSVKYRLSDPDGRPVAQGRVQRIGEAGGPADHDRAVQQILEDVSTDLSAIIGVGHRVVHGGSRFTGPVLIDDDVVAGLDALVPLAPLHNPGSLAGIRAARTALPDVPQVASFDTAFHAALPEVAATYAVDRTVAERWGIRRYGFHGLSYRYVSARTAELLGAPLASLNLIVLHVGNGASAAAIEAGRCIDTSMGLTPLEGLVMGTRGGDLDPGVPLFLQRAAGYDADAIDDLLEHHSGLTGLCGANDIRDVLQRRADGDRAAALAFDVYCYRIRKYIGAYFAVLGRVDAIVFTAGVGERSPEVRAASLERLSAWGVRIDPVRNAADARIISPDGAPVTVCVVPTDEEQAIAEDVQSVLSRRSR
jgi:acetate kinase